MEANETSTHGWTPSGVLTRWEQARQTLEAAGVRLLSEPPLSRYQAITVPLALTDIPMILSVSAGSHKPPGR